MTRGQVLRSKRITWKGLTASYQPHELDLMAKLKTSACERELLTIHELKALLGAVLVREI